MKIILASASPRRKELLTQMGLEFEVCPSKKEEVITKEIPSEVVMELARQKATDVANQVLQNSNQIKGENGVLVIGADTIVVKNQKILGKPKNEADAVRMLRMLQGDAHQVYTGVCLILMNNRKSDELMANKAQINIIDEEMNETAVSDEPGKKVNDFFGKIHTFYEKTDVHFYAMTEWEILDYVKTGDPLDKAGAYGIQGLCGKYIRGIEGDYHNVVGLPIARLYQEMKFLK